MGRVNVQWKNYEVRLPEGISQEQRKDYKSAFYAGAHAMLLMVAESGRTMSQEEAVSVLTSAMEEVYEYADDVVEGRE